MKVRDPINTETLQRKFPDVYRDFFARGQLVVSTSLAFSWTDDLIVRYRGLVIKQKLPLKTYVALEYTNSGEIQLGRYIAYNPQAGIFQEKQLAEIVIDHSLLDFIHQNILGGLQTGPRGFIIHCLAETMPHYGFGFFANLSALLSGAIALFNGSLSSDDMENWSKHTGAQLLQEESLNFTGVYTMARKIDHILKGGHSKGSGVFCSLLESAYPVVSFYGKTLRSSAVNDIQQQIQATGKIPFWGYRLIDLYPKLPATPQWPIDLAFIYSGKPYISTQLLQKQFLELVEYEDLKGMCGSLFDADMTDNIVLPDFYEQTKNEDMQIGTKILDVHGVISLLILKQLYRILANGYNEDEVKSFINIIYKRYYISRIIDNASPYMQQLFLHLDTHLLKDKAFSDTSYFCCNNVLLGGSVGLVTYRDTNRSNILTTIKKLKQSFSTATDSYYSWVDGYGKGGLCIEQWVSKNTYSPFIAQRSMKLVEYTSDGQREVIINKAEDVQFAEYDVFLNAPAKEIRIKGERISSKILHSQTATITLFEFLLQKIGQDVSNKELFASSYTTNKNELQGKILLPLIKLVKERTGKQLYLTCTGGIASFHVRLILDQNIRIGYLTSLL